MKILSMRVVVCIFAFMLLFSGCRGEHAAKTGGKKMGERVDEDVLAVIGDERITRADLPMAMQQIPEAKRKSVAKRALNDLIAAKVFSKEAIKAGLADDPEISAKLEDARADILARAYVRKFIDKDAQPADEKIRQYYENNKKEFVVPEGVLIQQIRVEKREDAEVVVKELRVGISFAELAKKESTAKTWKKGGSMGWQYRGWLEPAVEKAAFSLEKGKISDVIETKKGYEVIRVVDKKDRRELSFEESKEKIRRMLFADRKKQLVDLAYEDAGVEREPTEPGVIAVIGDERITEEGLNARLEKVSENQREKAKKRWVDYLIERKVFLDKAGKAGLEEDPEVTVRLRAKRDKILAAAFHERYMKDKFKISDKEVKEYYASHRYEFVMPVRIRAKSILVKTRQEAEKIIKELEAGASFGALAIEHSQHSKASRRAGEIGWFTEGEKDPAIEKVALALGEDQRSDIVKTEAGFEIIKVMKKRGGDVISLHKAKEGIRGSLMRQRLEEAKQRYYDEAGVKVFIR